MLLGLASYRLIVVPAFVEVRNEVGALESGQ